MVLNDWYYEERVSDERERDVCMKRKGEERDLALSCVPRPGVC